MPLKSSDIKTIYSHNHMYDQILILFRNQEVLMILMIKDDI